MKKLIAFIFACALPIMCVGCNKSSTDASDSSEGANSSVVEPVQVSFADIVIDLADPENVVIEADPFEESEVFDASGRKLTDKEWLLNSKFAKSYISSLPLGEHIFEYSSLTKYGTIKITITDNAAPRYLFSHGVDSVIKFEDEVKLPFLVKDQDSYQDDYDITYLLYKLEGESKTEISVEEMQTGYSVDAPSGVYQWVATASLGEKTHQFSLGFRKETFDEYIERKKDVLVFDAGRGVYVKNINGAYEINTTVQEYYTYSVSNDIIRSAIKAGKKIGVRLTMEEATKTYLWMTNNQWHNEAIKLASQYQGSEVVQDEKYIYTKILDLDAKYFANDEDLAVIYTSQFNPSKSDRNTWQSISGSLEIWFE